MSESESQVFPGKSFARLEFSYPQSKMVKGYAG